MMKLLALAAVFSLALAVGPGSARAESSQGAYLNCLEALAAPGLQPRFPSNSIGFIKARDGVVTTSLLITKRGRRAWISGSARPSDEGGKQAGPYAPSTLGEGLDGATWIFTDTQAYKLLYDPTGSSVAVAFAGAPFAQPQSFLEMFALRALAGDGAVIRISLAPLQIPGLWSALLRQTYTSFNCGGGSACIEAGKSEIVSRNSDDASIIPIVEPRIGVVPNDVALAVMQGDAAAALGLLASKFGPAHAGAYELSSDGIDRAIFNQTDKSVSDVAYACGAIAELEEAVAPIVLEQKEMRARLERFK
jgi:hypothetical protein